MCADCDDDYDPYDDGEDEGDEMARQPGSFSMNYDNQTHDDNDTGFSFHFNKSGGATEADVVRALKGLVSVGMDPQKLVAEIVNQFVELEEKK